MVKVVLENREAFQAVEERLNNAVQDFVDVRPPASCIWREGRLEGLGITPLPLKSSAWPVVPTGRALACVAP